jgi:hypothetical protein
MKKLFLITTLAISATGLQAEDSAFQASLTPDIAVYAKTTQINGLALSVWGENPQSALALGFVNGSTGESQGLSWGLVNYADSYTGVAWAFANISQQRFYGWQNGVINYSQGTYTGLQTGFVNITQDCHGLQAGFVNYSENLRGVQLGFLNLAMNNPWFNEFPDKLATGFPFVNWSF